MQLHTTTPVELPKTHKLNFYIPPQGFKVDPETGKHIVILKRRDASLTGQDEIPFFIDDLRPPDRAPRRGRDQGLLLQSEIWGVVRPAYEAFLQGHELPETGTALGVFPQLNSAAVELLHSMGYRCVEEVAEMSQDAASRLPLPNPKAIPKMARQFLENKSKVEDAERVKRLEEKVAQLTGELERRSAVEAAGGAEVAEGAVPTQGAAASSKPVNTLGVVHLSIRQCAEYWGTTNTTISKKLKAGPRILDEWCARQVRDRVAQGIALPAGMTLAAVEAWEASLEPVEDAAPSGGTEAAEGAGSAEPASSPPSHVRLSDSPVSPELQDMGSEPEAESAPEPDPEDG